MLLVNAANGGQIALHLGRDGEHANQVGVFVDEIRVAGTDVLARLRALLGRVDERALGVHAHDFRAVEIVLLALLHHRGDRLERLAQRVIGNGHRGGQPAGNTVLRDALRHFADAVGAAVGRVLTQIAVNVHIDQTGHDILPLRVDHFFAIADFILRANAFDLLIVNQRHALNDGAGQHDFAVNNRLHTIPTPLYKYLRYPDLTVYSITQAHKKCNCHNRLSLISRPAAAS